MSLEMLKHQIKTGEFSKIYILYGNEDYLKSYYLGRIAKKAVTALWDFNLQKFDGVPDLNKLASAVQNMPLMSGRKCVILHDPDIKDMKLPDWKELRGIIKNIPPECILIFHFDALKPNARKDTRFKSLLTFAEKNGLAAEINRPSKRDTAAFIAKRARKNSCGIDVKTAEYIIETCGADLNTLSCETDKICAFAGGGDITKEQVDAVAVKPTDASIYDLAGAVVKGRTGDAMDIINELFYKKEEPVIILSALSGAFCDLFRAKTAVMSGAGSEGLIRDFNYSRREFRARNAVRDSRDADIRFLSSCLEVLMKADIRIKSTGADKRMVLEQLIVELAHSRSAYR